MLRYSLNWKVLLVVALSGPAAFALTGDSPSCTAVKGGYTLAEADVGRAQTWCCCGGCCGYALDCKAIPGCSSC